MQAPLTPERLAATYEYLRVWPPFDRWHLPPAYAIKFALSNRVDCHAEFDPAQLKITISAPLHWHVNTVMASVAHEVIHLYQHVKGSSTRSQHNAEFRRLAKSICERYAWDYGQFLGSI